MLEVVDAEGAFVGLTDDEVFVETTLSKPADRGVMVADLSPADKGPDVFVFCIFSVDNFGGTTTFFTDAEVDVRDVELFPSDRTRRKNENAGSHVNDI